eukprot:4182543-Prymnesium_polylepis.1
MKRNHSLGASRANGVRVDELEGEGLHDEGGVVLRLRAVVAVLPLGGRLRAVVLPLGEADGEARVDLVEDDDEDTVDARRGQDAAHGHEDILVAVNRKEGEVVRVGASTCRGEQACKEGEVVRVHGPQRLHAWGGP